MDKLKISCPEKNEVMVFNAADATVDIWEQDDGMLVEISTATIAAQGLITDKSRKARAIYEALETGNFLEVDDIFTINALTDDEGDEDEDLEGEEGTEKDGEKAEKDEDEDW